MGGKRVSGDLCLCVCVWLRRGKNQREKLSGLGKNRGKYWENELTGSSHSFCLIAKDLGFYMFRSEKEKVFFNKEKDRRDKVKACVVFKLVSVVFKISSRL